ncbi:MAG: hypothetical protein J6D21_12575 [Clostridia bacterium]|nr:hypothetical protein [Clostridia bacterium]
MDNTKNKGQEYYVVDLMQIARALWRKAWLILLIGVLVAGIVMLYTICFVAPKYSASIMLYVNNKSLSIGSTSVSISASELSAAQSLVDTYITIMKTRTTMEEVAVRTGLSYTPGQLMSMITTEPVEGTEVFRVTVTTLDPYEAATIANCIAEVLPLRIAEIIEGSSMRIVDDAIVNTNKVSPSITKNTVMAFVLACLASCVLFAVIAMFDDTIRSDDNLTEVYNLPVLAKIPDLMFDDSQRVGSGYYYKRRSYGYGYGHGSNTGKEADKK